MHIFTLHFRYLNDPWALNKAKQNIEQYYAVVGTLEQMNVTLQVLETVLPQFFGGAYKVYHSLGSYFQPHLFIIYKIVRHGA